MYYILYIYVYYVIITLLFSVSNGLVIPESNISPHTGLQGGPLRTNLLQITPNDRKACVDGKPFGEQPSNRVNTTVRYDNFIKKP